VSEACDIFEAERVGEGLQAIGHGLGRIGIDNEYGPHLAISGVAIVPMVLELLAWL
jgi:hypothetical protein